MKKGISDFQGQEVKRRELTRKGSSGKLFGVMEMFCIFIMVVVPYYTLVQIYQIVYKIIQIINWLWVSLLRVICASSYCVQSLRFNFDISWILHQFSGHQSEKNCEPYVYPPELTWAVVLMEGIEGEDIFAFRAQIFIGKFFKKVITNYYSLSTKITILVEK